MTQSLEVRTALLLRTEMRILRDNKMRPLFQEAIVTELAVPQSTTRYQMKATDIIFPTIPQESLWVKSGFFLDIRKKTQGEKTQNSRKKLKTQA